MKKILVISPQSYPVTGAESIVNMKMLKALSNSEEFEIDLISKRNRWFNYPEEKLERYGVKLKSLTIIDVDNKINIKTIIQHAMCLLKFGAVFKGSHWAYIALPTIKALVKQNKYDYVLTKNSPSLLLGNYLKKHYGLKWIATWNDPCPIVKYPHPYGQGYDAKGTLLDKREIAIMLNTDIHVFPSDRIRDYMLKYLKVSLEKTRVIPHVVLDTPQPEKRVKDGKLKIVHSGNLQYPRNPLTFLKALKELKDKYNTLNLEFSILGVYDKETDNNIQELGLSDLVKIEKPVSYLDSLVKLRDYDVALIIEANCEEGIFMPTKVSDFMQCRIPIFAVSPQNGALNDLYNNGYIPYFADVTNVDAIFHTLDKLYTDYLNGTLCNKDKYPIPENFTEKSVVSTYLSL